MINGINTYSKIKILVATVKENDKVSKTEKLKKFCDTKGMLFIDNSNIDISSLNRSRLHLNQNGTSYLADNPKNSFSKWF